MFERLAIVGTGAIGSVIGAYLSRAGHDITLIDTWSEHVEAMNRDGLTVTSESEEFTARVKALHLGDVNSVLEPFDAIYLAVKSYDTVWATHFALSYLKPNGVIISSQNGVNDEVIGPIAGYSRELGCVVLLGAGLYEPAHVVHTGDPNKLSFALGEPSGLATKRAQAIADIMTAIGPTRITTNLWGERWSKLAVNCMANPVSASTGLGSAAVRQTPGIVDISIKIASEVVRVGTSLGVQIEPISGIDPGDYLATDGQEIEDLKSRLAENAKQLGQGRPSMLQDVSKGRKTEIDYLNGYVARRGAETDISTPMNEAITQLVRRVERGELKPDPENAKFLEAHL